MSIGDFDLDLGAPASNGVYRVSTEDLPDLAALARGAGLWVKRLDLLDCADKQTLLMRLATQLDFPRGFGRNWDALSDALRDLSWLRGASGYALLLEGLATLAGQAPEALTTLLEIVDEAAGSWARDGRVFVAFVAD